MLVEFGVSVYAAVTAHSPAMLAFGSDSLVELLSATVVLLQWIPSMSISERRASRTAGSLLFVLAFVVAAIAVASLALRLRPATSYAGTRLDQGSSSATVLKAMKRYFHVAERYKNLIWAGPNFHLGWTKMETAPEYPLWLLVRSASNLIISENIQNVRACDNPDCRRLFLHSTKVRPRRWCHMAVCGNRIKQRRFKASSKS